MGKGRVRFDTGKDDAALRHTNNAPPFSDEMKRDSKLSYESRKFRKEDFNSGYAVNDFGAGVAQAAGKGGKAGSGVQAAGKGGKAGGVAQAAGKGSKAGGSAKAAGKGGKAGSGAKAAGKGGKAGGSAKAAGKGGKGLSGFRHVGGTVGRAVGRQAGRFNEDLQAESKENLGLRTIDEGQKALVHTKCAVKIGGKATKTAVKYTGKAVRATGSAAKKAAQAAKKTAEVMGQIAQKIAVGVGRFMAFIMANPVVLAILAAVVLIISLIYMLYSSFQSTPKNVMGEQLYGEVQKYLREKDRALLLEFKEFEKQSQFADIAEEDVKKVQEVYPATSMKLMSSYLLAKYENALTFDIAKSEIDAIHEQLYYIEFTIEIVTVEMEEPVLDAGGGVAIGEDGEPLTETVTTEKRTLTVTLKGQTLKQYFEDNLDSMLTKTQKSAYDWFIFISRFGSGDFGPPFEDDGYMGRVTQEFGVAGVLDGLPHRGIDFSYPEGTPVLNIMGGTVVDVSNHYSWGLNVVVESDDGTYRVRYAHLSAITVGVGESVATGDVIGAVGNTGTSTGPHLHLEIEENGQLIDPREVLPEE